MRVYASAEMTLTDTNDGISVTGIDRYYMASSSSSGITVDSQGWKPDPQETNPISRYHWSYEVVNYSDGAKIPSKPAVIGVYGKEGVDAVTVSLSSEAHTFAGTESKAIASSLSIDIIAFKGNQRISTSIGTVTGGISGQLTHSELGRGTTNNKLVINVTNALNKSHGTLSIPIVADGKTFNKVFSWSVAFKGVPGDKGDTGDKGAAGTGIKSSEISYVIHTNGTTAPTLGWVSTVPTPKQGRYLWTRTVTTYTDNTTSTTYSVAYQATNGQQGAAGTGVSSTAVTYAQTTSGTTTPTSWSSTRPAPIKGQYLWSRTIITYTNGSSSTAYNTSYSATDGQKGDKGDKGDTGPQGPRGIQGPSGSNGQSQWVHIRYSPNPTGSGMTTSPSSTTKYVGIAVTNSATAPAYPEFTWSKYVGENGSRGPQGLPGKDGDDGTTTYTWVRYADTPTSGMNQYPDGKKYIGLAFNKTTQTESDNYSDYQWSLMPQNIEVGGRNYFSLTHLNSLSPSSWVINAYVYNFTLEPNTKYILSSNVPTNGNASETMLYFNGSGTSSNGAWLNNPRIMETDNEGKFYIAVPTGRTYTNAILNGDYWVQLEKGNTATDWTPAPEDIEAAYTSVAQAKAEAERVKAESYADGKVTAEEKARIADANAKLAAAKKYAVDQILADKTIKDTRNDNQTPAWYYTNHPRRTIKEFKLTSTIGVVSSEGTYGILETEIPWTDASGGPVKQTFRVNSKTFKRSGTTTSWSSWVSYDDIAETAKSIADSAKASASTANSLLTDIASDSKLTATEKKAAKKEWDIIVGEKPKIDSSADIYGITTQKTAYNTAYNTLKNYLSGLLSNLNTTSNIVGTTFRANFKAYYNARQDLLNKIADGAKSLVDEIEIGGRNLIKEIDPMYSWTGEHNIQTNSGAFVYTAAPHRPAMYQIEARAIDDSIVGLEFGWQWSSALRGKTVILSKEWQKATAYFDVSSSIGLRVSDGVGRIELRHIKAEKGNKATDWTPAPEDTQAQIDGIEDGIGDLYLADKTRVLSGQEVFTDKADEGGLAHAEVDGKSYHPNHITNLFTKKTVSGSTYSVTTGVVMQIIQGHKYYTRRTFTSGSTSGSYGSIRMLGVDTHNFTGNYNSGDFSQITEYTGETRTGEVMFYGSSGTPAGGKIENTFIIDLTGHFGAGNEPSVNEMNKLTDALGWFSGKKVYSEQISKLRTVPTPDYPIKIHDFNDFDIVSSIGRQNLIKNSQNYNYSADATNLSTNFVANLSEPLVKGQEYTFSFEIKADNPMTSSRIFINSSTIIYKEFQFDREWSRQYVSFTYDGGYYGSVDRPIHPHIYPSGSGVKYIQNIKLEKGNVATDWTPAPEDVSENDNHSLIDKVNLLLDKPLTGVGDVKDQLFKDSDGIWKIRRKIVREKLSNLTFTSTDPNGGNSYLFDDSVAFICTLKEHISTDASTWGNKIISSHFKEGKENNYNYNRNGGNPAPERIGTVHQINGAEYNRIFFRVPNSTIGATMNDSLSTLNSKMAKWARENDIDLQYHARNESVEVLPMSTQNKLNSLSSFAKSNYVYTVDDNNINPNLNVVFKSKGWKHKFATDKLETDIKDKVSTEDLTDVSNDLNTAIGDLSNTVDGKVDTSLYEQFLEHNANIQEQLSISTANAQEDITKALARTATVEQKLGEGAADWIFTHTQIRMSDEGITLGEQGSGSYLQITNDQISFYNGSEDPVAFINGGMLNINHAIFVESIQISEFMFSSEAPGHLTLRYVGN